MYILRPDIPEEDVESHLKKYSDLLTKADVKVLDSQMRGKEDWHTQLQSTKREFMFS